MNDSELARSGHMMPAATGASAGVRVADTFLAGAQKGGTTALAEYLGRHPACLLSSPKENHFFARAAGLHDLEAYARCFPARPGTREPGAVIDASTSYMMLTGTAARIRDTLGPECRFVFMLRAPVARAVAAYGHAVRKGFERRPIGAVFDIVADSLADLARIEAEAVERDARHGRIGHRVLGRRYDDPLWQFRYLGNSDYPRLLEPFLEQFGRDRVLVLLSEDLRDEPQAALRRIAAFLGLDPGPFETMGAIEANPTHRRRFNRLRHFLRRDLGLRHLAHRLPGAAALLGRAFATAAPPRLDPDVRMRLEAIYRPTYPLIHTLTGCDPSSRWPLADDLPSR